MLRGWRISEWTGLDGNGGLFVAGRWHSRGQRVLYVGEHPALALIESMAHMRVSLSAIPLTLKLIAVDIKDGASMSPTPALPPGWEANEVASRAIGDAWLQGNSALVLPVPSAIIAHARNYLINPGHRQASTHLKEAMVEPIWMEPRFLR
ncbi:MAG: RES family NAD+ phosphorylase [Rhodanobacteraceae bacterium]